MRHWRRAGALAGALCLFATLTGVSASGDPAGSPEERALAQQLLVVLTAARLVIQRNQPLINDLGETDKGLTGESVLQQTLKILKHEDRKRIDELDPYSRAGQLLDTQLAAIREVVDDNQSLINQPGVGFKGFSSSLFARLVNDRFVSRAGDDVLVEVVALPERVRNPSSTADSWEERVMRDEFGAPAWPRGEPYASESQLEGRPAFRLMVPEYHSEACLLCHGEPRGEIDPSGYPKEGAGPGELAGAISIVIFR